MYLPQKCRQGGLGNIRILPVYLEGQEELGGHFITEKRLGI